MAMRSNVMVRTGKSMLQRVAAMLVVLAVIGAADRALGAALTLEATKTESGSVSLCVGLDSAGEQVAGTQNDLVWDGGCATLKANSCAAVPDSKKPLHGNTPPNTSAPTYRALVFALDNVDPIRDGKLYCCEFELSGQGDGCCPVRFDRLGASDPTGKALTTTGRPDQLCLATGAAAPGAAPPAPAPGPAAEGGGSQWMWILLVAVAVVLVAILLMRGRSS